MDIAGHATTSPLQAESVVRSRCLINRPALTSVLLSLLSDFLPIWQPSASSTVDHVIPAGTGPT